jgi:Glycosyl transferases group 1
MSLLTTSLLLNRPALELPAASDSRALLLSMRRVSNLVGFCALYEFEDLVADLLSADLGVFSQMDGIELSRTVYKYARYLTGSANLAELVRPNLGSVSLKRHYELFLPFFNHSHEIYALTGLKGWRERCGFAACYLGEAWETFLPRYQIELLRSFDHIFVGVKGSVETIANICDRPCTYLPMGVDALKFCPHPLLPRRSIDVCGIGRRSSITHQALLDHANNTAQFYYYDTISMRSSGANQISFGVYSAQEHRLLFSNLLKRSRYFVANRAFADRPALTNGKEEIPARFYEGAAAGSILLGDPPHTEDFKTQFGWKDAVVRTPFDAPRIGEVIAELDRDPVRAETARRQNVINALLQHDWVYRLRKILEVARVPPTAALLAREQELRQLAETVRTTPLAHT